MVPSSMRTIAKVLEREADRHFFKFWWVLAVVAMYVAILFSKGVL